MAVSVRSYLITGAAAVTATTVALAPVQAPPTHLAAPIHTASVRPTLSKSMVALLAAVSQAPVPAMPAEAKSTGGAAAAASGIAPRTATPTAATASLLGSPLNTLSDWVVSGYQYIQGWVDWAVNYGSELAYWVGQFIPFVSPITTQVDIFYWNLIRPIADSTVYDLIAPVISAPLNLGVWVNGITDVAWSVVASGWNTVVAEVQNLFGWLIPPLPPRPPWSAAATSTKPLPTAATVGTLAKATTDGDALITSARPHLTITPAEPTSGLVASVPTLPSPTDTQGAGQAASTTDAQDSAGKDSANRDSAGDNTADKPDAGKAATTDTTDAATATSTGNPDAKATSQRKDAKDTKDTKDTKDAGDAGAKGQAGDTTGTGTNSAANSAPGKSAPAGRADAASGAKSSPRTDKHDTHHKSSKPGKARSHAG